MTKKKKVPAKIGRPSDLNDSLKKVILHLYSLNYTDKQVSEAVGCSEQTVNAWKKKDGFIESVKEAKASTDTMVEQALLKRALGYSQPEEIVKTVSIGNGVSEIEKVDTVREYAPDVKACEFWLKNRQPDKWREKQEVEHKVSKIEISQEDELL